ncbi:MAG: hypothetical protein GY838_08335 [bacterium]|nr:hypothetical protein [bacterium]
MREDRIIAGAFGVSLLLHLVTAAATWRLPFIPKIDPAVAAAAETEVEVLLIDPEEEEAGGADQPRTYVSLPERLASETPPDRPEYLALHDAVAADQKQGDSDVPSADEPWEAPMVQIQREQLTGAGGVAYAPQALPDPREAVGSPRAGAEGDDEKKEEADPQDERGEWVLPSETREAGGETTGEDDDRETAEDARDLEEWWGGAEPSILREGEQAAAGDRGFDFDQSARGDVGLGTVNVGEFTLNTVAWDWAPWMNRFANELHRHWNAPHAYRIGIISGMTKLRMIVQKDGTLSSLAILDTDGHESLHTASQAALKAFAPYAPLPPHFPEENLVITLSLHYPAWRH